MSARDPGLRRADSLRSRMPSVPRDVAAQVIADQISAPAKRRGVPTALERFHAHMAAEGRAPEQVTTQDFESLATSRTSFRTLMEALHRYVPGVPLDPARPVRIFWDKWLNDTYGAKAPRPRESRMVALLPDEWPDPWREAIPCIDRRLRIAGRRYRRLQAKSRDSVIQAVGMCALARTWALEQDVQIGTAFDCDLADVFQRFLLNERKIRAGSAADYFERVLMLARRAGLLDEHGDAAWSDHVGALRLLADDDEPTKLAAIRKFQKKFTLASILHKAEEHIESALILPAHTEEAHRLRRKAVIFALLVNGADRQGDLSRMRIGREICRDAADGSWHHGLRQAKTKGTKEIGALWEVTCRILDAHVLSGRPAWQMADRLVDLDGRNLISLEDEAFDTYHPSAVLKEDFGISGHLIRTLITNAIRNQRPDAAWAVKEMLGHSSRWMQQEYLTDFRMLASIRSWHDTLAELLAVAEQGGGH